MIHTFEGIPLLITTALQFFVSLKGEKTWVHDLHMASVELGFIPAIAMFSKFLVVGREIRSYPMII